MTKQYTEDELEELLSGLNLCMDERNLAHYILDLTNPEQNFFVFNALAKLIATAKEQERRRIENGISDIDYERILDSIEEQDKNSKSSK